MFILKHKRKDILSMDANALIVDDDEYWKNGWYSNPNDTRLFVPSRMSSTSYSMNMANPAAKDLSVALAIFITTIIVGILATVSMLNNATITFHLSKAQVTINATMYDTSFNVSEIKSVEILDKMPDDNFIRTYGVATDKILIGHFEGKVVGNCMMFLYRDYAPILEIKLSDKVIYINSQNENEVKEWYQKLFESCNGKSY